MGNTTISLHVLEINKFKFKFKFKFKSQSQSKSKSSSQSTCKSKFGFELCILYICILNAFRKTNSRSQEARTRSTPAFDVC